MDNEEVVEPVVLFTRSIDRFMDEIDEIIKTKNLKLIGEKINLDDYPLLTKKDKEAALFCTIHDDVKYGQKNKDVLDYLIWDYKISAESAFHLYQMTSEDEIKKIFHARDLSLELYSSLNNNDINIKKAKI